MSAPSVLFMDHAGVLGGAELYLLDVVRPLANAHVALFEDGPFAQRLNDAGVSVEVLPSASSFLQVQKSGTWHAALRALPGLIQLTMRMARRAQAYDVLFANSQKSLLVAGLAGAWARRPVIWNLHDMLTADHFSALNRRVAILWANRFTDRVIVNSHATQDAFSQSGGRAEKTQVVYNGIDPTPFDRTGPDDLSSLRRELSLPDHVPLVGVFSRLAPWKGQHVLIEALDALPTVHALLVGDSLFRGDASYEQTLRHTAEEAGVSDRVHFLGFRDDIPHLMHLVDVVLHTSTAPEPFGRVIVEGMLAARPVIATRAGGAVEIVQEPDTGVLVPPGQPGALADAIQDLLDSPRKARAMGRTARHYARERFGVETMQRAVRAIIHDVHAVAAA